MKRLLSCLALIVATLVSGCGQPSASSRTINQADGAAITATFETAKAELLRDRAATKTAIAATRPSPTATRTPTATSVVVTVAVPASTPAAEPTVPSAPAHLSFYLPDASLVPSGLIHIRDETLSAEAIADSHSDPAAHLDQLTTWGFQDAWIRDYRYLDPTTRPTQEMFQVRAVVVTYATPEDARAANEFSRAQIIDFRDATYTDGVLEPIGEHVLAMSGASVLDPRLYGAWIWVQDGNTAVQYLATAMDVDPLSDLEAIVRATIS